MDVRLQLEIFIKNLLAGDTEIIKQATNDINAAYKNPETILALCDIVVSNNEANVRQYAAVLLTKYLGKLRNWQMVPVEQQNFIKTGILNALVQEQEKSVRRSIATFVGALVRHETNNDSWLHDLLQFIFDKCKSTDSKQSEPGSSIFAILADNAPDSFVPHMEVILELYTQILNAAESTGNIATPAINNVLAGINSLFPFVVQHPKATGLLTLLAKFVPLFLKVLKAFTVHEDVNQFLRISCILDNIAEFTPQLLKTNFKQILEFCFEITSNMQLDPSVRVQTTLYIGTLVRLKKKTIIKAQLIEPILQVLFKSISDSSTVGKDEEDDYFSGEDGCNPVTSATQSLDFMAMNIPAEKLIPPLLRLLEPALRSQNPTERRAVYLCMAIIAEGCAETIANKYLENMLNIIKSGIADPSPLVSNAAFFALGQFAEHLQPKISLYAAQILPVLLEYLGRICEDSRNGKPLPSNTKRMFYALETFCENLEDNLHQFLPSLMDGLFEALSSNHCIELRELAMGGISATAMAAKENILPYFQQLVSILEIYLIKSDVEEMKTLRIEAIDTVASLARSVGKENFFGLAEDTMNYCLKILNEELKEPDIRRATYNLIGALASVVNENMANVFPKVINHLYESITSMDEVIPQYEGDLIKQSGDDDEFDIELSDNEDDLDGVTGFNVENDFLYEKEEAILCLKEFSDESGAAFGPYLETAFENVYKMIDHPQETIRKACFETLTRFVIALKNLNGNVKSATAIFVPTILKSVREEEEILVVITALDCLADIAKEIGENTFPKTEFYDTTYEIIVDVFSNKLPCQFDETASVEGGGDEDDNQDSELDDNLIQTAGNLIPVFGGTMEAERFAMYFGRLFPRMMQKFNKPNQDEDVSEQRNFLYGVLSECVSPLAKHATTFFDTLFPIFIKGLKDSDVCVRQNACFGVGELVYYSEEKSYEAFPMILQGFSEILAKEDSIIVFDNICGAVARLILTNYNLVPLNQVLPVLLQHLPLQEDFAENYYIIKCFKLLVMQVPDVVNDSIEQILVVAVHILLKKEYTEDTEDTVQIGVELINNIRQQYPERFEIVANTNAEVYSYVQSM